MPSRPAEHSATYSGELVPLETHGELGHRLDLTAVGSSDEALHRGSAATGGRCYCSPGSYARVSPSRPSSSASGRVARGWDSTLSHRFRDAPDKNRTCSRGLGSRPNEGNWVPRSPLCPAPRVSSTVRATSVGRRHGRGGSAATTGAPPSEPLAVRLLDQAPRRPEGATAGLSCCTMRW